MNPTVPPTIPIGLYLSGAELPTPSHPLGWEEAKQILASSQDAEVHLATIDAVARNLAGTRTITAGDANAVLEHSPVALWGAMRLADALAANYPPLDLYRLTQAAGTPPADDEARALHLWATAEMNHEWLSDPFRALEACREYLELSDGHTWLRPSLTIAGIVLDAAIDGATGPIAPIGEAIMLRWEQRIIDTVESFDPDYAYTENQLLDIWKSDHQ
ncbi:hypothetical protein KBX19_09800 [Corynebacterium sp. CCUG 71335]|uniref:hypothetical protein n=1 Tax=Corynebacterium sp. CCUG 71335 TaxID=2823892 RepID=UPI00210AEF74|nr:hypothetical protein [Corynebacterium sp. CCUG 71335]MCQ4621505.1 hypothetical protein [Corynebacterium sp. CCUG 71335]